MYIFIVIILLIFLYTLFNKKEGFDNMLNELPINISNDNSTISIPNMVHGNKGNDITFGVNVDVNNNTIHKGNTFIKPAGSWVDVQPSIDMAIGDNDTGLKWKSDGIISFWGNSQEIGTFGWDGMTLNNTNVVEFGKNVPKEVNAGKIGYQTFTGDSLDIVGAGQNAGSRKVHIYDDLNVGNNLSVGGNTTLNQTTINQKTSIVGGNLLEFGANTGKGWDGDGSISYKTSWDPNALNIVGAENGGPRKVHMWDDVVIDGNLWINNGLTLVTSDKKWTLTSQDNGQLHFLHNDTAINDFGNNAGHVIMSPDGNLWLARSTYQGWVADNENTVLNHREQITAEIRAEAERLAAEAKAEADRLAQQAQQAAQNVGRSIRRLFRW